jgi:defect-in-organelle-trafficking protein DotC
MKNALRRVGLTVVIIGNAALLGCSYTGAKVDTESLSSLQNMTRSDLQRDTDSINSIRYEGLKETALTLGAQAGLYWQGKQIDKRLTKDAVYLRNIFNFDALMLEHGVKPPILSEANNTLNLDGSRTLRISDKTYKIIQQARFATTPPHWRNYLWMSFSKPELPDKTLLPRNRVERQVWSKTIAIGWTNGVNQANTIFSENLARLKRDYQGMLLYRKLLALHMISKPYVAKTNLGVTGDGSTMHVNDQVLRITATPQLQTDSKNWKPVFLD